MFILGFPLKMTHYHELQEFVQFVAFVLY